MGREIRRVPPNWEHPRWNEDDARYRDNVGKYRPCFDTDYATASAKWKEDFAAWEAGTYEGKDGRDYEFWEYAGVPDPETCRPAFTKEPTWWQVYETVSEGTPASPPFPTGEELVGYLSTHGDFSDQRRGDGPWSRENAEAFVLRGGWVPTAMVIDGRMVEGRDIPAEMED